MNNNNALRISYVLLSSDLVISLAVLFANRKFNYTEIIHGALILNFLNY